MLYRFRHKVCDSGEMGEDICGEAERVALCSDRQRRIRKESRRELSYMLAIILLDSHAPAFLGTDSVLLASFDPK